MRAQVCVGMLAQTRPDAFTDKTVTAIEDQYSQAHRGLLNRSLHAPTTTTRGTLTPPVEAPPLRAGQGGERVGRVPKGQQDVAAAALRTVFVHPIRRP